MVLCILSVLAFVFLDSSCDTQQNLFTRACTALCLVNKPSSKHKILEDQPLRFSLAK